MGGKTRQSSSSTQTVALPANQQQNVDTLMQGIQQLWQSGGPQFFPGQNYTTATPYQQMGREALANYAQGPGQQFVNEALAGNQFWMDPRRVTDLESVPGYGAIKQGLTDTITRNFTEGLLPQTMLGGAASGNLGGSRNQMMQALGAARTSEALANSLGQLDLGVYGQNLGAQQAALSRAPQMYQLGMAPGMTLDTVGSAQRADQAEKIAGERERWDFQQNQLPRLLAMVQALTGQAGQYGGTTTQQNTQTQSGGGGLGQFLGPAMMLASMFIPGGQALTPLLAAGGAASSLGAMRPGLGTGPG